jgi:DNA-binding CsgD family transcriptional regulator/catechol 2,3-dioxygenase-like lactoylglutathione lyase family enzyme
VPHRRDSKPRRRGRTPHPDQLTPGEWRIVDAVRHGLSNAAIAARRGISADAVKFHVRNAVAKLGLTNRGELKRWRGAPLDGGLTRASKQKDPTMTTLPLHLGPIGQISRNVRNIDEACEWYGSVLGLAHMYTFGKLAFFDCGGTRLFLNESEAPGPESILYFRVPDIAAAHAELTERGVEFSNAPHMIFRHADGTEEWMAFFKDREGRPLALLSQVKAPS